MVEAEVLEGDALVEKVMSMIENFAMSDSNEGGEDLFNDFAKKHAALFEDECDASAMENKLEYTNAYKEFCATFEERIEKIIADCGTTVEKFFEILKNESEQMGEPSFYVELILAITDYHNFVDMMKHYKKEHQK